MISNIKHIFLTIMLPISFSLKALTLQEFISTYNRENSLHQINLLSLQTAENNLARVEQFSKISLTLTPMKLSTEITNTNGAQSEFGSYKYLGSLSYTTTLSTELALSSWKQYQNDMQDSIATNYSLSLSQPILKNSFGHGKRQLLQSARSQNKSEHLNFNFKQFENCKKSIDLFLRTYSLQEKKHIMEDMKSQSIKVLQINESNYSLKLIGRIEYLSAKADYLELVDQHQKIQNAYQQSIQELNVYLNNNLNPNLIFSNKEVKDFELPSVTIINSRDYQNTQEKINELSSLEKYYQNQNLPDVNLLLSYNNTASDQVLDLGIAGGKEKELTIGVSIKMPIYDNSTSLDLTDARIEKKKKEYQLKDLYQNFEQTLKATKQDIEFDENLMSNQQERINIYSERENEARKRLSQAKIDYSDYIRYRDALLNEKIKAIDTTTSLFFKKLDLYSISDTIPKICEDK